jgi:hypothetical protein
LAAGLRVVVARRVVRLGAGPWRACPRASAPRSRT